ncbi:MAG: tetratricopeptide repeat protein [Syntrophobacteria bacterium]
MQREKSPTGSVLLGLLLTILLPFASAFGQEINLDKLKKCGDLLCYQSLDDPLLLYYYLPDLPRLAVKEGRPQFSFLKYARTRETGEAGIGRAEGGGIVHFLVTYGADRARVRAAERALQEEQPEARIAGPVVYRKGSFALITSFQEGNETLSKTVAVGKAPLMEGQKAAVSMNLTREGAELLWESFKSATPDISLVFDMEFAGVREPYEATLKADWKRVSDHQRLKAGFQYAWFGADIDMLFQELRQTGAITITTKGEDASLDKILQSAHAKLLQVMFDPAPDELTRMAAEKESYSNLDRAVKLLKDAAALRKSTQSSIAPGSGHYLTRFLRAFFWPVRPVYAADEVSSKEACKQAFEKGEQAFHKEDYAEALEWYKKSAELYEQAKGEKSGACAYDIGQCLRKLDRCPEAIGYYREAISLLDKESKKASAFGYLAVCLEEMEKYIEALDAHRRAAELHGPDTDYGKACSQQAAKMAAKLYNRARRLDQEAGTSGYQTDDVEEALQAYERYLEHGKPSDTRADEVRGRIRMLERKVAQTDKETEETLVASTEQHPQVAKASSENKSKEPSAKEKDGQLEEALDKALTERDKSSEGKKEKPQKKKKDKKSTGAKKRKDGSPGFSLVASYRLKKIKRSGHMLYHLNHYRTETQAFAMAENIGDLYRRYGSDPQVFRAVTIDDPVFKQREVLVTLDGQDAATFSEHMNFVTVQMKKLHQSGEVTTDEVVITPEKFNESGNAYVLSYGWKGDHDRTAWLDYQVRALWSFHGGVEIRTPWTRYNTAMLALEPPHRYRTIAVEGEGERLAEANVRHAVVTVTSMVGGKPVVTQATIRNRGPAPSVMLDVPEEREGPPCEVSITWYLRGGEKVTSPALLLEGDILYWDELPEKGV